MTTAIEYALMAGRAYQTTRAPNGINWFPVPTGWSEFLHIPNDILPSTGGFEMSAFQNTANPNEIVISYAGTGPFWSGDWTNGNVPLAFGNLSEQLKQAADYYLQVRALNSGATITFTGHSLGGGLASLMAVLFDESAFTFDQAPFRNSAEGYLFTDSNGFNTTRSVALSLRTYLEGSVPDSMLARLDAYIVALDVFNTNRIWADTLAARETKVTDINVQGEILSYLPFSRIGSEADIAQQNNMLFPQVDLHSQALLTAFLQSNQTAAAFKGLNDVTFELPDLLKMIFDTDLFARDTDWLAGGSNADKLGRVQFLKFSQAVRYSQRPIHR